MPGQRTDRDDGNWVAMPRIEDDVPMLVDVNEGS